MNLDAKLVSWDPSTATLTYSVGGVELSSTVVETTTVHRASLNRYAPTDPILPIVKHWNTLIDAAQGHVTFGQTNPPLDIPNTFSHITGELADAGANMQIHLKPHSDIIASLRPIPFIPPNPI